jgi:hypothetical protein
MAVTVQEAVKAFLERLGFAASEPARPTDAPPRTGAERGK